jgi:hypothetical protein
VRWYQVSGELMKRGCLDLHFMPIYRVCLQWKAWWHCSYASSAPAHAVLDAEESVKKEAQRKGTCHPPPSPPCAMPLQKKRFWRARWYFCFSYTRVSVCMYCVCLKVSGVALLYTYKGAGGKHLTVIPCSTSSLILH